MKDETKDTAAATEQGANVAPEKAVSKKGPTSKKSAPKGAKSVKAAKPKAARQKAARTRKTHCWRSRGRRRW